MDTHRQVHTRMDGHTGVLITKLVNPFSSLLREEVDVCGVWEKNEEFVYKVQLISNAHTCSHTHATHSLCEATFTEGLFNST